MARRSRKVNVEQKDKLLKPKKTDKQSDPEKSDGPFAANLKLDKQDAMTITQMQHTVGNKAIQRLVVQRFFGSPMEEQIESKAGSPVGNDQSAIESKGLETPAEQQVQQPPIEMKGGLPVTEQQGDYAFPESKAGTGDDLEFKVGSQGSHMEQQAPDAESSSGVEKIEQSETTDRPTLFIGSQGAAVIALQRRLQSANPGSGTLVADGIFGPITREHVLLFQKHIGLKQDGIVGINTWRALDFRSENQDVDPKEQQKIREKKQEALEKYQAGDFQAAREDFEGLYQDSTLEDKPLQLAGIAYNVGLCVQQIAASNELELEEQREVMFKEAMNWYSEAANTPSKADRLDDLRAGAQDRIRECRAKEPPKGEPYGLEQIYQPEAALEEELEEHEAQ